jgi:hypothetical protein
MSETEQPLRATPVAHQCVCLLIHVTMGNMRDKCYEMVNDPDSPFCGICERGGHPAMHEQAWDKVVRER